MDKLTPQQRHDTRVIKQVNNCFFRGGAGRVMAYSWQGVGKDFASSSKLFELANTLPRVWEEREKSEGRVRQIDV